MARQRAFTQTELLDATEQLLLERGYESFHMKSLADSLHGARSTIYEYYANKEEVVAACMRRAMQRLVDQCADVFDQECVAALRQLFVIFLRQAGIHKMVIDAGRMKVNVTGQVRDDLDYVDQGHELLKGRLMGLFERARMEGHLRTDIPVPAIAAVFFHAIETPNWLGLPDEEWAHLLFSIWWNGGENKASRSG